jgi:hypothetical protein
MQKKLFVFFLVFSLSIVLTGIVASPGITVYPGVVLYTRSGQMYVFAQPVVLQQLYYDPSSDKWVLPYETTSTASSSFSPSTSSSSTSAPGSGTPGSGTGTLTTPPGVWLPGQDYLNASSLMDYLTHPFSYAVVQLAPLGGITFLYASFSLLTMAYTYLHFKSALSAGVVALTLAAIGIMVPEVAQVAWLLTALGLISIVYKVIRWVVG